MTLFKLITKYNIRYESIFMKRFTYGLIIFAVILLL